MPARHDGRGDAAPRAARASTPASGTSESCSLTQTLEVLGERWMFLIMREAFAGATRFSDFRDRLGVAPDVLTARLNALVEGGVMDRREYREPGTRQRLGYHLTEAGRELAPVLGALQAWGNDHRPSDRPRLDFRDAEGRPVHVRFVSESGQPLTVDGVFVSHDDRPAGPGGTVPTERASLPGTEG